jgi:exodeoxyribonuclease VII large subunit
VTTRDGLTITSAQAARQAGALTLHFRHREVVDVTVAGAAVASAAVTDAVEGPAPRPQMRRKPRPDQPTLL